MDNSIKIKLSIYGLLSAVSFIYLILTHNPGISVPVFTIIQFVSIFTLIYKREEAKNKKGLLMFVPIFILSLNYYLSGSYLWRAPNFLCTMLLYSTMVAILTDNFPVKELSFKFLFKILEHVIVPLRNFNIPFKWINKYKSDDVKKKLHSSIILGIFISLPFVVFLLIMLSSADLVFSVKVENTLEWFSKMLDLELIFKIIFGMIAGLYLFGLIYIVFAEKKSDSQNAIFTLEIRPKNVDTIVINILLSSILLVYTLFIFIQFKYLFAGSVLPGNLNYAEYARRGFFELIFLSFLNIGLILLTVYLYKEKIYVQRNKWSNLTKIFMMYLCAVTFVMLISSFYRMYLYDQEYGFTRLRVLVYGFLIFESIGLIITAAFIMRPEFNIMAVYMVIGLCYYLCLNVVQIDYIIAKHNVDMYLAKETDSLDIDYLMSLSVDAAPQIARLVENKNADIMTRYKADLYFKDIEENYSSDSLWQSRNYSIDKAIQLISK
ncbi:DUF4153 domain-containing protein [Sedimentibacter saalensis]|uniref:Uncharacterized protein DUF4173 n=1 Tax=Sedimentibacter saalensis TaxID=130788 RepID=A0A562JBV0_9FIRM|nr:DUF4173 domain-containing protein [Sedimentibacter saalensis]TWH80659.1 uncharacterized protein DUF4173 [Sedimentibacter saalensis]